MQTSTLMLSSLSAWGLAIAYDIIERVMGLDFKVLVWAAVAVFAVGLYRGLHAKSEDVNKEEA